MLAAATLGMLHDEADAAAREAAAGNDPIRPGRRATNGGRTNLPTVNCTSSLATTEIPIGVQRAGAAWRDHFWIAACRARRFAIGWPP